MIAYIARQYPTAFIKCIVTNLHPAYNHLPRNKQKICTSLQKKNSCPANDMCLFTTPCYALDAFVHLIFNGKGSIPASCDAVLGSRIGKKMLFIELGRSSTTHPIKELTKKIKASMNLFSQICKQNRYFPKDIALLYLYVTEKADHPFASLTCDLMHLALPNVIIQCGPTHKQVPFHFRICSQADNMIQNYFKPYKDF